ncbi:MAG: phosphatidate cytidylyltransferase [Lachnospiraceae bacterium]|nr:phosphatidate cytidylyltransferase [Lachnospiraceae bacterium]
MEREKDKEQKNRLDSKNTRLRVLSGIVLAILLFGTCILGGIAWYLFSALIAAGGIYEFYKLHDIHKTPEGIVGYVFTAGYWVLVWFDLRDWMLPLFIVTFLVEMGIYVFRFTKTTSEKAMASVFGLIYPAVLASYLQFTRTEPDGLYLALAVFAGSWGSDVFAWLFGSLFGRHRLNTPVSPKKTWEGVIGGILGSAALGLCYGLVISLFTDFKNPGLTFMILAASASLVSMIGDLTASAFKRHHGVKDYSNLIPGHGGILDRFDSVLFVAPVIYYGSILLSKLL